MENTASKYSMVKTVTRYFLYDTTYDEYVFDFNGRTTQFTIEGDDRLWIEDREEAILASLLIQRRHVSTRNIELYEVVTKTTKVERD